MLYKIDLYGTFTIKKIRNKKEVLEIIDLSGFKLNLF
jgi:hypothetical protein